MHPRLAWKGINSWAAGPQKAGARWGGRKTVYVAQWMLAMPLPQTHCGSVTDGWHFQSFLLAHPQELCAVCRPGFSQAVGFHMCSCMESPLATTGCPLQSPILSSLSQLQAAWATFLLPESLSQATGCLGLWTSSLIYGPGHCPFHHLPDTMECPCPWDLTLVTMQGNNCGAGGLPGFHGGRQRA